MIRSLHCSIDNKPHEGQDVAKEIQLNLVLRVVSIQNVLQCIVVGESRAKEEEAHHLPVEVARLLPHRGAVAQRLLQRASCGGEELDLRYKVAVNYLISFINP